MNANTRHIIATFLTWLFFYSCATRETVDYIYYYISPLHPSNLDRRERFANFIVYTYIYIQHSRESIYSTDLFFLALSVTLPRCIIIIKHEICEFAFNRSSKTWQQQQTGLLVTQLVKLSTTCRAVITLPKVRGEEKLSPYFPYLFNFSELFSFLK